MQISTISSAFARRLGRGIQTRQFTQKKMTFASQNAMLIRNGTVVNADRQFKADVRILGSKITEVGPNLEQLCETENIVDAKGNYVIPGGIDTHTHMELNFMGAVSPDCFYNGTKAALAGGTTMLCDFILPEKGTSLIEAYDAWREKADNKVTCDYTLHTAVTSWTPEIKADMARIVNEKGVNSFKFFLAYKDAFQLDDTQLVEGFSQAKDLGALSMVHAENGDLCTCGQKRMIELGITGPEGHYMSRPDEVEAEATHRAITIAHIVNTPLYVVHVMSKLAAEEIARARQKGFRVFGEPLAAGLGTDGSKYWAKDFKTSAAHVMGPPLNPDPKVKDYLMNCLKSGSLQCVGTDNCTFTSEQKKMGAENFTAIPNGVNGIEDRMAVVWQKGVHSGILTPSEFVGATSTNAAKIFNMYPQKGVIAPGSDADVVIWNGNKTRTISAETHHHAIDFNVFEGMEVHGIAEKTISKGEICWEDGNFTDAVIKGRGSFVARKPFGQIFDGLEKNDDFKDPRHKKVEREQVIPTTP